MTHPRKAHSARLVAVLVSLATAPAVGAPQSDAPKKGGSSWKLPPSSSPKSPSSASKDDDDAPAGGTLSQADAAALVAMAHAQRVASARGGVVGAWNDSVQLYFAQSTELLAPESFLAVSSPTVIDLAPGSIGLFVQHFPITDGLAFGSIARATSSDGGSNWSQLERCTFEGLPAVMDGPANPCVCSAGAGKLRMYFVARDYSAPQPARVLLSALSTDQGRTWRVEPSQNMPLDERIAAGAELFDLSATTVGSTTYILIAVSNEGEPLLYACAVGDGVSVMRPMRPKNAADADAGATFRGSATSDKAQIIFTGMPSKEGELLRVTSRTGSAWKAEPLDANARPPLDGAIDVAYFNDVASGRHLYAIVTRDDHPLPQSPLPTTPLPESPPTDGDAPPASSEDGALEVAPTGRKTSDPVAAPVAPEVRPLGGKKSSPVGGQKGPTAPPMFSL